MTRAHTLFLSLLVALIAGMVPQNALAGTEVCLLDGRGSKNGDMPNCLAETDTMFGGKTNAALGFAGARVNHGPAFAVTPIDPTDDAGNPFSKCRYVDASSGDTNDYFVPFRTVAEWESFLSVADNGKLMGITTRHCARPFGPGIDEANNLYFGPTTARPDLGDTPAETIAPVTLPYWPTGSTWPPSNDCENCTHPFSYSCDEQVSEAKCWNWVTISQTCCAGTYVNGVCSGTTYDCSYTACEKWGSVCKTIKHTWKEQHGIQMQALDSDIKTPSWKRQTGVCLIGQNRPAECLKRCTTSSDGFTCTCKTEKAVEPEIKCPDAVTTEAACGCANGSSFKNEPAASNLCLVGTVSAFAETATGWSWTCTEGVSSKTCSAKACGCYPWCNK